MFVCLKSEGIEPFRCSFGASPPEDFREMTCPSNFNLFAVTRREKRPKWVSTILALAIITIDAVFLLLSAKRRLQGVRGWWKMRKFKFFWQPNCTFWSDGLKFIIFRWKVTEFMDEAQNETFSNPPQPNANRAFPKPDSPAALTISPNDSLHFSRLTSLHAAMVVRVVFIADDMSSASLCPSLDLSLTWPSPNHST